MKLVCSLVIIALILAFSACGTYLHNDFVLADDENNGIIYIGTDTDDENTHPTHTPAPPETTPPETAPPETAPPATDEPITEAIAVSDPPEEEYIPPVRLPVIDEYTIFGRLPAVHITTENNRRITSREVWVRGELSLVIGEDTLFVPDFEIEDAQIQIRGRGNSTWLWAKRPYRVRFDDRVGLFGMPPARNWVLLANHADKSLLRNHVAMTMGQVLYNMPFVPGSVLVDLYLNGVYQGVYNLLERIDTGARDGGRVQISESGEADTGFLLEIGGTSDDHVEGIHFFSEGNIRWAYVRRPAYEYRTPEQMAYITDFVRRADEAVTALSNYEDYICIPALIDWFILHELSFNIDSSFRRSTYIIKDAGGKLKMGPPWDFDLAFGNFIQDQSSYRRWASVFNEGRNWYIIAPTWMDYLMRCPRFIAQLQARWEEIGTLVLETALREIDLQQRVIYESQARNFRLWPIEDHIVQRMSVETRALTTWEENLDYLRNFLTTRFAWMDNAIRNAH